MTIMEPLVTISIATYKGLDYLKNCSLPSILIQDYQNFEVLISNDGPDSDLQLFVESLNDSRIKYSIYPRVKYANEQEARCTGGARGQNINLSNAQGKYIAELDQDDFWAPDFLRTKVNYLEANPDVDFIHSLCAFSSGIYFGKEYNGSAIHNTIGHLTILYKNHLKKYKFIESGQLPADFLRWQEMYKRGVKMKYLPIVKTLYNQKDKTFPELRIIYRRLFGVDLSPLT